jgi:hypothetical protein
MEDDDKSLEYCKCGAERNKSTFIKIDSAWHEDGYWEYQRAIGQCLECGDKNIYLRSRPKILKCLGDFCYVTKWKLYLYNESNCNHNKFTINKDKIVYCANEKYYESEGTCIRCKKVFHIRCALTSVMKYNNDNTMHSHNDIDILFLCNVPSIEWSITE